LQTPPFPEYNSALSTISSASATVLAAIIKIMPHSWILQEEIGAGLIVNFKTSDEAALEVSFSRLYGEYITGNQ
jgi:hypothetical protein